MTISAQPANLIATCDDINADEELNALVDEWQEVPVEIEEPWDEQITNN